jgi:hypothetical protein
MFGPNSAGHCAHPGDRVQSARSAPNGLLLIDQTENISPQGNPFTVSDTGLL